MKTELEIEKESAKLAKKKYVGEIAEANEKIKSLESIISNMKTLEENADKERKVERINADNTIELLKSNILNLEKELKNQRNLVVSPKKEKTGDDPLCHYIKWQCFID